MASISDVERGQMNYLENNLSFAVSHGIVRATHIGWLRNGRLHMQKYWTSTALRSGHISSVYCDLWSGASDPIRTLSTKATMDPEGARLLTYCTNSYSKPRLCVKPRRIVMNIHAVCVNIHYNAPRLTLTGRLQSTLHYTQYTSEGSMSSFKSITWNELWQLLIN